MTSPQALRDLADEVSARQERNKRWLSKFNGSELSPIVVNDIKPMIELLEKVGTALNDCASRIDATLTPEVWARFHNQLPVEWNDAMRKHACAALESVWPVTSK